MVRTEAENGFTIHTDCVFHHWIQTAENIESAWGHPDYLDRAKLCAWPGADREKDNSHG